MVVPRNEVENLEVVDIAEDYYKVKLWCLSFSLGLQMLTFLVRGL